MISLTDIERRVRTYVPASLEIGGNRHAAVAMILRQRNGGVETLFIERARHQNDPWSGQMAFPGGMVERSDPGAQRAAERETEEEVGIDLTRADYLGQLDDQQGRHRGHTHGIVIQGYVYVVPAGVPVTRNYEVRDVVWAPLDRFLDPRFHTQVEHPVEPGERFPGTRISDRGHQVVWGLTRRFMASFFHTVGIQFDG